MKVPVYDTPQVAPSELPGVRVNLDPGEAFGGVVGRAVQNSGEQIGQAANAVASTIMRGKQQADDARVTQALTSYQGSANNSIEQIRGMRGEDAMAASKGIYDNLDREQENLTENMLANDEQRRAFSLHVGRVRNEASKQIESYVHEQTFAAYDATAAAHEQQALRAVQNDYKNEDLAIQQFGLVNDSIRKLQRSPSDGDAKMQAFRANVSQTRIDSALAAGDYEFAQKAFEATRDEFGDKGSALQQRINIKRNEVQGDAMAQKLVGAHLDSNGRPIEGAVWADVDQQPPGEFRKALEQQVQSRLSRANQSYQQSENDRLGRVVTSIEGSGGSLDQSTDDFQQLSPADKAKALERKNALMRTDRTEQRTADREELARFSALPREDQTTIDVNTQFPNASQTARYQMQAQQKVIRDKAAKGDLEPIHEFDEQLRSTSVQLKLPKPVGDQLKAQMDSWYLAQQRANGGKAPTRVEVDKEMATQLQHRTGIFGLGGSYRFQAPGEDFQPDVGAQPYDKVRGAQGGLIAPGKPAAPAQGASRSVTRTKADGTVITWDGKKWVRGG